MADKPKLCANCGKLMGIGDECPYCGADNRQIGIRLKRLAAAGGKAGLTVTIVLVGINLLLFALAIVLGGAKPAAGGFEVLSPGDEMLFRLGLQDNAAIDAGQWWRVVTPVFLHLGLIHVAFNCFVLWVAGRMVEEEFGGRLMLFMYLTAGILGFVASYFANLDGGGASGAVAGMLGAVLVRRWLVDKHFGHPHTRWVLSLLVLNVVFAFAVPNLNHVAHIVGLVVGAGMAAALTKLGSSKPAAVGLMLGTWLVTAGTVVAALMMVLSLFSGGPTDLEAARNCWEEVHRSLGPPFEPTTARRAASCLGEMPRLEGPANDARDRAHDALRDAVAAHDLQDDAGRSRGIRAAREAEQAFDAWLSEAYPRYGFEIRKVRVRGIR